MAVKEPTTHAGEATLPPPAAPDAIDYATLQLLESWRAQDATSNAAEIQAAEQELADFKKAMNENRSLAGQPPVYP
jgi:hypothetical protein